ncbi:hypothetical protein D770_04265 [Flammeovirgaceae bacterium 311]|nr:hypothetical protein D770_04265 [Flammeovirgaceae bacterium 311]
MQKANFASFQQWSVNGCLLYSMDVSFNQMKVQLIIIALLGLLSCNTGTETNMPIVKAEQEVIEEPSAIIDSLDYVVLKYDTARSWMFPKDVRPAELSKEEIADTEVLISKQIDKYNQNRTEEYYQTVAENPDQDFQLENFIIENQAKYTRQYVPVINSEGEKLLYVNAYCSLPGPDDWKTKLFRIMGGGDCYFQAIINLSKKEVVRFNVNAPK